MSKSATEQYQIKKKRKHNQNHDSNNNNNNNNTNNKINKNKNKNTNQKYSYKKRQRSASTQRLNENSCFDFRVCFQNCIRDQTQTNTNTSDRESNRKGNSNGNNNNGNSNVNKNIKGNERSRNFIVLSAEEQQTQSQSQQQTQQNENRNSKKKQQQQQQLEKMPLSQGYYVKTAFATKRGSKPLKVIEAKRKATSEQFYNNNNNNNCFNYYNNNAMQTTATTQTTATGGCGIGGVGSGVGSMSTGAYRKYANLAASTTTTATLNALLTPMSATQQQQQQQQNYHNHQQQQHQQYHHQQQQQQQQQQHQQQTQNSLEILYLIGESFAHCGCLPKAFDLYELIASRQQDGYIPLDKLSALANALIKQIRQLGGIETAETNALRNVDVNSDVASMLNNMPTTTTATTPTKRQDYALESTLKARYTAQHEHTLSWQTTAGAAGANGPCLPQRMDMEAQDVHLLDLHAPTRELSGGLTPKLSLATPTPTTTAATTTTLPAVSPSSLALAMASDDFDPLLCPLCRDILRSPVTTNCGHTFCRQCCETITMCNICHIKFPRILTTPTANEPTIGITLSTTTGAGGAGSVGAAANTRFYNGYTSSLIDGVNFNNFNNGNNNNNIANAMPITVTTTTVASTTSTATTTMASSSSASLAASSASSSSSLAASSSSSAIAAASLTASPSAASAANSIVVGNNSNNILINGCNNMVGARSPDNMKFMPDVLVRNLVEKWWGAELQAKKISETAASYMHLNLLDDALKYCNASLEKSPTNFKSLCMRAEVLLKLSHYQSSLADVENALKSRCISAKAHYLRALALSGLGRLDEALYDGFLAICLDKTTNLSSSEIFQHDLAKILQRLLAQTPKCKPPELLRHSYATKSTPYGYKYWEQRMRRKKLTHADALSAYVDCDVDVDEDVDFVAAYEKNCCDYITADAEEAEESLFANAYDYMDKRDVFELRRVQEYELEAQRYATRKHCRRKWPSVRLLEPELELEPHEMRCSRCSQLLRNIIERTQHELQRLRKLEATSDAMSSVPPVPLPQIDASDFECVVCSRTLWKPVVTPCGHTYCLVCLDRCMDYKSPCPLCMSPLVELNVNNNNMYQGSSSPVPFALAKRPVTKFLEAAMKRFIPDIYETRFRQEIDMEPSVPVFICTTAFPCVPCPLFVCDPRYRLMVRRAVESGEKTFGIVEPYNDKSRYADFGTILDIRDCVLLGDGCFILSTIGCKRFKILARSEKDGYETANVEYICDEPIADDKVKFVVAMHALVLAKAAEWFESLSTDQKREILQCFGDMPPLEDNWELLADGPAWAWWIIALLPLPPQLRINILATTSLEKRLRAIEKMLDRLNLNYRNRAQQHQQQQLQQQQAQQRALIDCDDDDDDVVVDDVVVDVGVDVDVDVDDDNDVVDDVDVDVDVSAVDDSAVAGGDVVAVTAMNTNEDSVDECCLRTTDVSVSVNAAAAATGEHLLL